MVWNPYKKKNIFLIENVQRRASKLVHGLHVRHSSYGERLRKLGLPTLIYRRFRIDMIQVFKILKQIDDIPVEKFFTLSLDSRTRGYKF